MDDIKPGDNVSWNTPQGKTDGKVTRKITSREQIQGHNINASPGEPQYEVESTKSGKKAAHKPDSLENK